MDRPFIPATGDFSGQSLPQNGKDILQIGARNTNSSASTSTLRQSFEPLTSRASDSQLCQKGANSRDYLRPFTGGRSSESQTSRQPSQNSLLDDHSRAYSPAGLVNPTSPDRHSPYGAPSRVGSLSIPSLQITRSPLQSPVNSFRSSLIDGVHRGIDSIQLSVSDRNGRSESLSRANSLTAASSQRESLQQSFPTDRFYRSDSLTVAYSKPAAEGFSPSFSRAKTTDTAVILDSVVQTEFIGTGSVSTTTRSEVYVSMNSSSGPEPTPRSAGDLYVPLVRSVSSSLAKLSSSRLERAFSTSSSQDPTGTGQKCGGIPAAGVGLAMESICVIQKNNESLLPQGKEIFRERQQQGERPQLELYERQQLDKRPPVDERPQLYQRQQPGERPKMEERSQLYESLKLDERPQMEGRSQLYQTQQLDKRPQMEERPQLYQSQQLDKRPQMEERSQLYQSQQLDESPQMNERSQLYQRQQVDERPPMNERSQIYQRQQLDERPPMEERSQLFDRQHPYEKLMEERPQLYQSQQLDERPQMDERSQLYQRQQLDERPHMEERPQLYQSQQQDERPQMDERPQLYQRQQLDKRSLVEEMPHFHRQPLEKMPQMEERPLFFQRQQLDGLKLKLHETGLQMDERHPMDKWQQLGESTSNMVGKKQADEKQLFYGECDIATGKQFGNSLHLKESNGDLRMQQLDGRQQLDWGQQLDGRQYIGNRQLLHGVLEMDRRQGPDGMRQLDGKRYQQQLFDGLQQHLDLRQQLLGSQKSDGKQLDMRLPVERSQEHLVLYGGQQQPGVTKQTAWQHTTQQLTKNQFGLDEMRQGRVEEKSEDRQEHAYLGLRQQQENKRKQLKGNRPDAKKQSFQKKRIDVSGLLRARKQALEKQKENVGIRTNAIVGATKAKNMR
jgi:hypothetical protein